MHEKTVMTRRIITPCWDSVAMLDAPQIQECSSEPLRRSVSTGMEVPMVDSAVPGLASGRQPGQAEPK